MAGGSASTTGTTRTPTPRAPTPTSRSARWPSAPTRPGAAGAWPGWCSATRRTCSSRCCSARRSACMPRASGPWPGGRPVASYLTIVFLVLSPVKAVVFILVQQGLFGLYLGMSFAPNHKGMPILDADDKTDFLRRQVLTSRNVRGGWLTDTALGGLNYQIEHHLFPSMPRPNLRRAQALIKEFCQQHGLPYCQASLAGSYAQALRHLHAAGRAPRPAPDASP